MPRTVVFYAGLRPTPPPVDPPAPGPDVALTFDPADGFLDFAPGTVNLLPKIDPATWNGGNRPSAIEARAILKSDFDANPGADPLALPAASNGTAVPTQPGVVVVAVPNLSPGTEYAFVLLAHFEH
jgi:hypothetical protein